MPTISERPAVPAAPNPPRKRWTRAELALIEGTGVFDRQRVELIEGELIEKMPKNPPHVDAATLLLGWLMQIFGIRFVNSEAPIDVAPEDQPVPDIIVLKRESKEFRTTPPQAADLNLVVEVADTSLPFDLTTKAALYARAGIVEYWVVDLVSRRIIVHGNAQAGSYESVISYDENDAIAPLAALGSSLAVREIFPE